ncbi:MAG: hypothetical protein AB7G93_05900 [Bdellovibrionales bacterium]
MDGTFPTVPGDKSPFWLPYFIHPIPLAAVALMVLNDHALKYAYPGWWTGKLSDFCGLFFFPVFLASLICFGLNLSRLCFTGATAQFWIGPGLLIGCIAITDVVFVAIKLSPFWAQRYVDVLSLIGVPAVVVQDPTDLLALVSGFATYAHTRRFFGCLRANERRRAHSQIDNLP